MQDWTIDRRELLAGGALLGMAAAMPGWAMVGRNPAAWSTVGELFDDYVPSRLPGLVAALGRGTGAPQFVARGTLARDSDRLVDADSLYRVYSMSKPVTAMAAMLLIEEGAIGLDQDVGDFVSGFKQPMVAVDPAKSLDARRAKNRVTVRGLMTHSAGLGYVINIEGALLEAYRAKGLSGGPVSRRDLPGLAAFAPAPDLKTFADRIAALPLMVEPGTRWRYSAGIDVLGRVIEVASGMPLDAFLRKRLFEPLGMSSSWFRVPQSELPRMTTNYGVQGDTRFVIDDGATTVFADPLTLPLGGGGLVTSPRDYDRFLQMLAGEGAIGRMRVMKAETARLAMSNLLPPGVLLADRDTPGQGFGAGGRVYIKAVPGGPAVGAYGWGGAAATVAIVDRARGVRASGFAQYMPDRSLPFTRDFQQAVYAGL